MSTNRSASWKEKDFEAWFRKNPRLPDGEPVLIVGIHRALRRMVDLIALDEGGGLVIVEVKNESSNRTAIGQALEYLSLYDDLALEELADDFADFEDSIGGSLYDAFRDAFGRDITKLEKRRRVFLVAPRHDAYSAVCTSYLAGHLDTGRIEFNLLEATADGDGFKVVKVQPKPFRRLGGLPQTFAVNPRAGRLFYVIDPGPQPIVWNIGRWHAPDGPVTVRAKPSRKLLRRYRSHLLPLDYHPRQIDLSITGSIWRHTDRHGRKAIVIGQITAEEAGQPRAYVAFAEFRDGQFGTFRRRPTDDFYSNWQRTEDEAVRWPEIVDQADAMIRRRTASRDDDE